MQASPGVAPAAARAPMMPAAPPPPSASPHAQLSIPAPSVSPDSSQASATTASSQGGRVTPLSADFGDLWVSARANFELGICEPTLLKHGLCDALDLRVHSTDELAKLMRARRAPIYLRMVLKANLARVSDLFKAERDGNDSITREEFKRAMTRMQVEGRECT